MLLCCCEGEATWSRVRRDMALLLSGGAVACCQVNGEWVMLLSDRVWCLLSDGVA